MIDSLVDLLRCSLGNRERPVGLHAPDCFNNRRSTHARFKSGSCNGATSPRLCSCAIAVETKGYDGEIESPYKINFFIQARLVFSIHISYFHMFKLKFNEIFACIGTLHITLNCIAFHVL